MIYFTSDLHFGHTGIITMCNRPFADRDEMNEALVQYYNAVVHKNDTCYILGDVAHKQSKETTAQLVKRLNGRKILISATTTAGLTRVCSMPYRYSRRSPAARRSAR